MAEYMTINNNIIEAIYCGEVEENENIIILPENHEVRQGETLDFYNKDFTRKSDIELMKQKLIDIPQGYIIDNDLLREMNFEEKIINGLEQVPSNQKIVEGKLVNKTEEEMFEDKTDEEKILYHKNIRNNLLSEIDIELLKYEEQVLIGYREQDDEYKKSLLIKKQKLRDLPQTQDLTKFKIDYYK